MANLNDFATLAQLVEQCFRKAEVPGPIPGSGSKIPRDSRGILFMCYDVRIHYVCSMRKISFRLMIVVAVFILLISACAIVYIQKNSADIVIGNTLSLADNRHIENVTCEGVCNNVLLVSDQRPDIRYFGDDGLETCTEVNLWANITSREGQIIIGGYGMYDGFQKNLRTYTVAPEAIDGRTLFYGIPKASDTEEKWDFALTLRDRQEWNVLDTLTFVSNENPLGFLIITERDTGLETLIDTCTKEQKNTAIYTLYQAPEVHGPGEDDTYRVMLQKRMSRSAGSTTGWEGEGFEKIYSSRELDADVLHIVAPYGETTFSFDLVRDE